jgi:hypothetical protein
LSTGVQFDVAAFRKSDTKHPAVFFFIFTGLSSIALRGWLTKSEHLAWIVSAGVK